MLTASGKDKDQLTPADFVVVDENGVAVSPREPKPSAETLLHVAVYAGVPAANQAFRIATDVLDRSP